MITALSRCFVLIVALSIFAITLPVRAEVPQSRQHRMSCCAHMAGERGHCGEANQSNPRPPMLPGLYRWAFVVFGLNRGFYFLTRRRRKIYRRDRRLIITVRTVLLFHRRAPDCLFASARSRLSESNSIQQEETQGILLMIITALAMIGTATATARRLIVVVAAGAAPAATAARDKREG